jgi:peptidyl-prolyl cis-trans isomerase D
MILSRYSKRFEVANVGHVIAELKYRWFWFSSFNTSETLRSQFLKQRKAELIKAKMTGSSMEAIAKSAGSTVLQATDVIMEINVNRCGTRAKGCWNCICFGS